MLHAAWPLALYRESLSHCLQTPVVLPASLNLPATQGEVVLDPSQLLPAGHAVQDVRVFPSPPPVYEPTAHTAHAAAPAWLYDLSEPHLLHALAFAALKNPAPQVLMELVPRQLVPAAHGWQSVCVVDVPPVVKLPSGHVLQLPLEPETLLYCVSSPHSWHAVSPALLNFPGGQLFVDDDPSQVVPPVHFVHVVRVAAVPPDVLEPAPHVRHALCPAAEYVLSKPQAEQAELPEGAYVPAPHCVVPVLDPSHALPAAHLVHVNRVVVVPPAVKLPGPQNWHRLAPAPLNDRSSPHGRHAAALPLENLPGAHILGTLDPSQCAPGAHGLHEVREPVPPPPAV